jgi:replicative DNA helicase
MSDTNFTHLPSSKENEEALIGAMMNDPSVLRTVDVSAKDFFTVSLGWVWEAAQSLDARSEGVDPLSIANELGSERAKEIGNGIGCVNYLIGLITAYPLSFNARNYARRVKELAQARAYIRECSTLAQAAYENDHAKARQVIERMQAIAAGVSAVNTLESVSDVAGCVWDWVIDPEAARRTILPLGFGSLDTALGGGLDVKTLTVLMARPAMGKTAALAVCRREEAV